MHVLRNAVSGWKTRPFFRVLLFGLALSASSAALAQEGADGTEEKKAKLLDEVVVTATRTERSLESLPSSVSVITQEEIEKAAAFRTDELLRELPGVYVRSYQGILSSSTTNDVSIRGLTGEDRVLVLVDGIPVNDPYGGAVEWNETGLDDLERIEVVRGPGSALYGSNAMGGVVNIMTKKPGGEFKASAKAGYGEMNTSTVSARSSAGVGRFGYFISGSYLDSDGYCDIPKEKKKSYHTNKEVERKNFNGKLGFDIDDTSFATFLFSHYEQEDTGRYKVPGYEVNADQDRYGLSYRKDGGAWNIVASAYKKDDDSDYTSPYYDSAEKIYNAISYISSNDQETYGGSVQFSVNAFDSHLLTVGGDYKRGKIDRKDDYLISDRDIMVEGKQEYMSLFVQDEISIGDKLSVVVGGRYDWWESFDGYGYDDDVSPKETDYAEKKDESFNPKVGANYRLFENTTLRGSAGTAFRAPGLSDLYRTYVGATATYRANPDLDPEKLVSYEFGIDQYFGDAFLVRATFYHTDAKDFVENIYTETIDGHKYYDKKNVGKVRIQGVEVEANWKMNQRWSAFASATFNETKIREYDDDPDLEGQYLAHSPRNNYAFGLEYGNPDFVNAKLTGRYVGRRFNDDANDTELEAYFTTDLKVSRKIGEHVELSFVAENINDVQVEEASGYVSPGRMVMGFVEVGF